MHNKKKSPSQRTRVVVRGWTVNVLKHELAPKITWGACKTQDCWAPLPDTLIQYV